MPDLLIESPIKQWRSEAGLSQRELSKEANVSLMTVIRNEQGLYPDPSAKIIQTLISAGVGPLYTSDPWKEYEKLYHDYQMQIRSLTEWGAINLNGYSFNSLEEHPFLMWRELLGFDSRLAFCRAACVSSPQVLNYELARQRTMPKSIRAALNPFVSIRPLDELGRAYYDATH